MSSIPQKKVTNILLSFMSAILSLSVVSMRPGLFSWADTVRKRLLVTAITRDAGTPFPLTSPMQKNSLLSLM